MTEISCPFATGNVPNACRLCRFAFLASSAPGQCTLVAGRRWRVHAFETSFGVLAHGAFLDMSA